MGLPGASELLIIMVIVLIIFGGARLAGVGKSLGTAIAEFKDSVTKKPEQLESEDTLANG